MELKRIFVLSMILAMLAVGAAGRIYARSIKTDGGCCAIKEHVCCCKDDCKKSKDCCCKDKDCAKNCVNDCSKKCPKPSKGCCKQ